jgi:simple sugar transport system ATP-binding protein
VPTLSLAANTLLTRTSSIAAAPGGSAPALPPRSPPSLIERFRVKGRRSGAAAKSLSGGNLQKFLVGARSTPSRSSSSFPADLGRRRRRRGADPRRAAGAARPRGAVLVVSEELEELFEICDRLLVIAQGRVSPSVAPPTPPSSRSAPG